MGLHKSKKGANPFKPGEKKGAWWYLATWFGCGLSPVTSGTVGSLGALPFAYIIHVSFGAFGLMVASILMFAVGVWASNQYLAKMESSEDPGEIVVDEVAGQWLALSLFFPTWQSYLVGFVLFRFFDIFKPWPVSWADRKIKGGMGVMLDDMLAGLYPAVVYVALLAFAENSGTIQAILQWLGGVDVQ